MLQYYNPASSYFVLKLGSWMGGGGNPPSKVVKSVLVVEQGIQISGGENINLN